ncbi:16S rRNA (guanine(966)-N(2))-methyltransferase RsmD [Zafaria sp. Z1313]|uniref:16S rRNA (guanine(966)-N(2))-methyltransferase RsmD n=1 Tax=unclassified Zafaria TaxID=2828765 RepID=UPI002E7927A4|nr:16S rRNA (guanine(966)-N(2))-methyltransferase RsmD [Zafaria sp. J156]MEE1620736.1 16S rRNA (guanine(966)-N(2))-methyltransferase RsmD [Zafaria sp. J156]
MSRIIGGAAGGLTLASVSGDGTRPTTDRVKESLFARLDHLDAVSGCRVLDLYAGSGALGLEAASRGAHRVVLVDVSAAALKSAKANAARINKALGAQTVSVVKGRAPSIVRSLGTDWDLVFLDPPYPLAEEELARCLEVVAPHVAPDGLVVVERSSRSPEPEWPAALERTGERRYGETVLWFAEGVGVAPA